MAIQGHVLQAGVTFEDGADTRATGGAVTVALCGSWEHEGACRWPHYTSVNAEKAPAVVRVLFVVDDGELALVTRLIETALRSGYGWVGADVQAAALTVGEAAQAERMRSGV